MTSYTDTPQPSESVAAQLRDMERQGGGMATFAHVAAGLLLFAFSAGSLVSISHAAFVAFIAAWQAGRADIPDGISLVVNLLLVLAADIALLYAASVLRVLVAARAPKEERRVHVWAMAGASLLESSTYLYLAWQFDRPTEVFLWLIVLARALGAPLFAAYLSMARPLPVAPRDVAYQAALASGKGVIRDVATLAADPAAPLHRKVRIYTAAAMMTTHDRSRFDGIISAVSDAQQTALQGAGVAQSAPTAIAAPMPFEASQSHHTATPEGAQVASQSEPDTSDLPTKPPTGGGTPSASPVSKPSRRKASSAVIRLTPERPRRDRRTAARANARSGKRGTVEQRIRAALAADPTMTHGELVRQTGVSDSSASKYMAIIVAERAATSQDGQVAQ